jgi:hypothetical protein
VPGASCGRRAISDRMSCGLTDAEGAGKRWGSPARFLGPVLGIQDLLILLAKIRPHLFIRHIKRGYADSTSINSSTALIRFFSAGLR